MTDTDNLHSTLSAWRVGDIGIFRHDEVGDIEVEVERIYSDGPAAPALGIVYADDWHAVIDPSRLRPAPAAEVSR
ncbi:hypothetical protein GCM10022243_49060 [Saccharothrix violaceirubra]|uniref:Uncharacterized protein n=1 Tax=Saccharothrix violaceirubra TaxID=413306 RepID=A0A7W7WU29_9PSEU|nr:hypothetical protein [Saccharothrix violaceirubra]MBB4963751.1 hypothetical protein [Saccharothrix violaceirubra]